MAPSVRSSPLLSRPGAVASEGRDAGVAAHYGDPLREQRLLAAGEAVVDLSHRPVLRVTGPDRLTWLQSLTTQHLLDLQPGRAADALVLSPQGHVEHHLQLVDDGEQLLAHVEPGYLEPLVGYLDRMRFLLRVEVADATAEHAVVADAAGWVLVPRDRIEAEVGDRPLAGVQAHEALRVEQRLPRLGVDTDHRTLPNETRWLATAVHLDKGCYRGQEAVARVHNLGRPPRRLALLHLDGSVVDLPAPGDPVLLEEREVGRMGSVVRHHELGPVGLALLRRAVPEGAPLVVGGIAASPEGEDEVVPPSPARQAAVVRQSLMRHRR